MSQISPLQTAEMVVVLDFGGQYTQLIARRVRECKVYCEILSYDTPLSEILAITPKAIILSGGPSSVYSDGAPDAPEGIFECGVPILGICYGTQLMAHRLGGKVSPGQSKEYGKTSLSITNKSGLLKDLGDDLTCWMSHGDLVESAPKGFTVTAQTPHTPVAAMENVPAKLYGVQFHPEVVHTPFGNELIKNFLYGVCELHGLWTPASFVDKAIAEIRETVGDAKVVCGVSGGVDSSVVAALIHKAIGDQLTCIFVDHGLLRLDEGRKVKEIFENHFGIKLIYANAEEKFLNELAGVLDPERKRKIIGEEFVRVFEQYATKIEGATFLAQGTLYPDVIESGTKNAAVIKSHHNVGGLPEHMNLKVLEPLKWLFKDEARAVGLEVGLPEDMVWRHPFPGPGLGIRVVGEVTKERLDILRFADAIAVDEIKKAGWYRKLWMGFAFLIPVRSVGVMGDQRTYDYTIGIRAVTSDDAMTADWAKLPYELLEVMSSRIINEVEGVNRVVYDISSKPPATMEWE